jgi:signal transduction histidine kinase
MRTLIIHRLPAYGVALALAVTAALFVSTRAPAAILDGPALTTVKAIETLGPIHGDAEHRTASLTGVVVLVDSKRDSFKLHDGERTIGVSVPDGGVCPEVGDNVEVGGRTSTLNVQEFSYPHVRADEVRVTGKGKLPAATPVSIASVVEFKHYNQWVSTEGVIIMWTMKNAKLSLMILGADTWAVMHVQNVTDESLLERLHGARVRLTGVNMGKSHSVTDTMIVPSPAFMKVLTPGTEDIFDAPQISLVDVAAAKAPVLERVKVKGVITARTDDRVVYLRDGNAAVCALLVPGWIRSAGKGQSYGDAGELPDLKPGDEVEVIGSVQTPGGGGPRNVFSLSYCHARIVGRQAVPLPVESTIAEVAAGALTNDLVQLRGRLLNVGQVPAPGGEWRTSMMIEAEGVKLPVTYQSRDRFVFRSLRTDDEVLVTGLVDRATKNDPRQIWLPTPASVQSLGLSPVVRAHQLQLWGGLTLGAVTLLGGWIVMLRRSLTRQELTEATVRELNATLEQRVAERTDELERAQSDLHRALKHERELGELKSRFVTMVSHEFRTPLGITMSAVELMRHYDDKLPAEQRHELCEDIYSATRNMAGLMEQVLVLGRVEAGKLGYRPAPLDLNLLAVKLTDESLSATNRRCPIQWKPVGDLSGVRADESLLRHIFGNLITNAVKYSPAGREVLFTARRDGGEAVFEVIDQGIGIPVQDREQLFEAFHRCSNVGDVPGTGLGLVIVKRCVELHSGSIDMWSETGKGTRFTVRLPLFAKV